MFFLFPVRHEKEPNLCFEFEIVASNHCETFQILLHNSNQGLLSQIHPEPGLILMRICLSMCELDRFQAGLLFLLMCMAEYNFPIPLQSSNPFSPMHRWGVKKL